MDQAMVNHHDQTRNREEAPVLEVPKASPSQETDPQLLTITLTRDAAIPHPLFILGEVLGYFHCG